MSKRYNLNITLDELIEQELDFLRGRLKGKNYFIWKSKTIGLIRRSYKLGKKEGYQDGFNDSIKFNT